MSVGSLCSLPLQKAHTRPPTVFLDEYNPAAAQLRFPIEWLWLKDFVWHTWEIWRLEGFKRRIIEVQRDNDAYEAADRAYREKRRAQDPDFDEFAIQAETIDPRTLRQLTPKLNTEEDSLSAFLESIDILERLEQQIAFLERRRDNTLREIELHREIRARRPRETSAKLIDVKESQSPVAAE
jgi:hypothetical protein